MANRTVMLFAGLLFAAPLAWGQQDQSCVRDFAPQACAGECAAPSRPAPEASAPLRFFRYAEVETEHRLSGLASYYSTFFDGRKTANGEIYRNRQFSAAHLTLPLGCWIEVTARATGKKLRLRVNDRGPFAKKFMLDLSQAAARFLGVDLAADRHVDVHVIALPGEDPPDEAAAPAETIASAATAPGQ